MVNAKILVATTKPYWMPDDELYLPVRVGAALAGDAGGTGVDASLRDADGEGGGASMGVAAGAGSASAGVGVGAGAANGEDGDATEWPPRFTRDDVGEHISEKNPRYCELTALYWGWRNLDCEYLGLVHYRRHFRGSGPRHVLAGGDLDALLEKAPVVVARPRDYHIETVKSHYAHTFDVAHFDALAATIAERSPAFLEAFEQVLGGTRLHICNMAVMRRDILDAYCTWLFDVLFACEERIDFSGMTPFEQRVMGRLAERLLDTWLLATNTPFTECAAVNLEKTNWAKKGGAFLAAKFLGRPYKESF